MLTKELLEQFGEYRLELKYVAAMLENLMPKCVEQILSERERQEKQKQPLLTLAEIAEKFKVTKATIHNWRKEGLITGSKVGKNRYFTEEEVRKALAAYRYPQANR